MSVKGDRKGGKKSRSGGNSGANSAVGSDAEGNNSTNEGNGDDMEDDDDGDQKGMVFNLKEIDITSTTTSGKKNNDEDDDDWEVDENMLAQKKADEDIDGMSEAVQAMMANEESELPEEKRLEKFAECYNDATKTINEVFNAAEKLDVTESGLKQMIKDKLQDKKTPVQNIAKYDKLLCRFCMNNIDNQKIVLGATEQLVSKVDPSLMEKMPSILHMYYEKDILDEGIILGWAKQSKSKYTSNDLLWKKILKNSQKFVDWLENAESESDDDDADDDDDVTIAFGGTGTGADNNNNNIIINSNDNNSAAVPEGRGTSSKYVIPTMAATTAAGGDDSDLDLDDI